jgi:hypothetical protein
MASPWQVTRKARNRGKWWQPREWQLEERASVRRHFRTWARATYPNGAIQGKGENARRITLTWKEFTDHVRKHEASWMPQVSESTTVRLQRTGYRLAA